MLQLLDVRVAKICSYLFCSLVTRRGTLLMETGLLHDYFGIFSTRGERCYFMQGEIKPTQGEIETNIGKLGNSEKLKFPFWLEGTFGDDI